MMRQIGRGSPFAAKGPIATSGNKIGRSHPSSDICCAPILPVSGYNIKCHDKIARVCGLCDKVERPNDIFPINLILFEKIGIMKQMYLHGFSYPVFLESRDPRQITMSLRACRQVHRQHGGIGNRPLRLPSRIRRGIKRVPLSTGI